MRPIIATLILVLSFQSAPAMMGMPDPVNPAQYRSPSGEYILSVDPSDIYGRGPATYQLEHRGATVWSGEKPFTFHAAEVADDGLVAGYAYSFGVAGFAPTGGYKAGCGELRVALIATNGEIRVEHTYPRECRIPDSPPHPLAAGLLLDPTHDRLILRTREIAACGTPEVWRMFRLTTGAELDPFDPRTFVSNHPAARFIIAARPIPGTPLLILHWWRWERDSGVGALFMLVASNNTPVWSLELPRDYTIPGDEKAEDQLRRRVQDRGAILAADRPGEFELYFAAATQRVAFTVAPDGHGGWNVAEKARAPFTAPAAAPVFQSLEKTTTNFPIIGKIALPTDRPATSPIRNVCDFDFDAGGRIVFIRAGCGDQPALVRVDAESGAVLNEIELAFLGTNRSHLSLAPSGDTILLAASDNHSGGCWRIDFAATSAAPLAVSCPVIKQIAAGDDGAFAVLASDYRRYTIVQGVYAFDATGGCRWRVVENGYRRQPEELLSPKDLALDAAGNVAVLDNIRRALQFFGPTGDFQRIVALEQTWGRTPNYPTDIAPDADNGYIIHDFNTSPCIVRIDSNGLIRSQFDLVYPDGRRFNSSEGVRRAPDGALWASDRDNLLRVSASGIVERALGRPLTAPGLEKPVAAAIGPGNRIYLVADRTYQVSVFDSNGLPVATCVPDPTDYPRLRNTPKLTVSGDGGVWLALNMDNDQPGYIHFAPDGTRLGRAPPRHARFFETWSWVLTADRRWITRAHDVALADAGNAILATVARRPDRTWLNNIAAIAVAPGGGLAVLARDPTAICLYDAKGQPLGQISLPESFAWRSQFAFNGQDLFLADGDTLLVYDRTGAPVGRIRPGVPFDRLLLSADGRELWLFDSESLTITRLAGGAPST